MKKTKNTDATEPKGSKPGVSILSAIPTFIAGLLSKFTARRAQPNRVISLDIDVTPRKEHQEELRAQMLTAFDEAAVANQESPAPRGYSFSEEYIEDWRNSQESGQNICIPPENYDEYLMGEDDDEDPMSEDDIRILQHLAGVILDTGSDSEHKEKLRTQILAVFDETNKAEAHQQFEQIIMSEKPSIFGSREVQPAPKQPSRWHHSAGKLIEVTKRASFRYAAAAVLVIGFVGLFSYLTTETAQASTDFAAVLQKIRKASSVSYTKTIYKEGQKPIETKVFCTKGKWVQTLSNGIMQTFDYKNAQAIVVNPKTGKKAKADLTKWLQNNPGAGDYLSYLKKMHKGSGRFIKQRHWENQLVNEFHIEDKGTSIIIFTDVKSDLPVRIETIYSSHQRTTIMTNITWTLQE